MVVIFRVNYSESIKYNNSINFSKFDAFCLMTGSRLFVCLIVYLDLVNYQLMYKYMNIVHVAHLWYTGR